MALMQRPNSHLVGREVRDAVQCATVAALLLGLGIASVWNGLAAGAIAGALLALPGFFLSYLAWQRARALRALGLEVTHGQLSERYEVTVRLYPERRLKLARLTVELRCVEILGPRGKYSSETRTLFAGAERLFEGRATLGNGEHLEKTVSFALPGVLEVTKPKSPEIAAELKIISEADGAVFEQAERVTLDLPVRPQVTLSQM